MDDNFAKYNGDDTILRKAQLRIVGILINVDKICRKHNIPYWIDYGTLLGAVRHGGFIPWDDDVDICVLDRDYKKLRKCLKEELPSNLAFQDYTTDPNAFFFYGRVRDKNSYFYYPYFTKLKEQGLCLDIFRVNKVGSLKLKDFADFIFRRAWREIHNYGEVANYSYARRIFNKISGYLIFPFSWLLVKLANSTSYISKNKYLVRYAAIPHTWTKEEYIFPLSEIKFEGHIFLAPNNFHEHLKLQYGDYMSLPKIEDRKPMLDIEKIKIW